jgi:O-methyltransferase
MKQLLKRIFRHFGYELVRSPAAGAADFGDYPELSAGDKATILAARPFTLTGVERMAALIGAVNFISENKIPGDIVECGVWRGGSMVVIARTLLQRGDVGRTLYLYDTFAGMPPPTDRDRSFDGQSAQAQLDATPAGEGIWARAGFEDASANVLATGYPAERIRFIKGKVEDTIPQTLPGHLALLRLDTDWYESTRHELIHLFPLLDRQGLMIIDDYGHFQGAKQAVDEYFQGRPVYLHRIDYTARLVSRGGP